MKNGNNSLMRHIGKLPKIKLFEPQWENIANDQDFLRKNQLRINNDTCENLEYLRGFMTYKQISENIGKFTLLQMREQIESVNSNTLHN